MTTRQEQCAQYLANGGSGRVPSEFKPHPVWWIRGDRTPHLVVVYGAEEAVADAVARMDDPTVQEVGVGALWVDAVNVVATAVPEHLNVTMRSIHGQRITFDAVFTPRSDSLHAGRFIDPRRNAD
jgi:hypothetical protein